jgi:beta-glucanase (GH16 family)
MNRARPFLALALGLGLVSAVRAADDAPGSKTAPPKLERPGWTLTFHDEFDGSTLDTSKWLDRYWHGRTHSNNEQQYYAPDGYEVRDGSLRLIARRREMGGMPYTSGMVCGFDRFAQEYGRFEIRAKFPPGKGMWPAFWLLPADKKWPPEIDVLEILGHQMTTVHMTNHWKDPATRKNLNEGGKWVGPDFGADFHVFAAEWSKGLIVWYVDGVERFRSTRGVPDGPMYVIANLAVGGDWPGNPDASTVFPGVMEIDYIRVYKKNEAASK